MQAISQLDEKLHRFKEIQELKLFQIPKTSISPTKNLGSGLKFSRITSNINNSVHLKKKKLNSNFNKI